MMQIEEAKNIPLSQQFFYCSCGYNDSFQKEDILCMHIKSCEIYQNNSITFNLFQKNPIVRMNIQQLLIHRIELKVQIDLVNEQLFNQNYAEAYDGNYEPLKQLEKSTSKQSKVQGVKCLTCNKTYDPLLDYQDVWYLETCNHVICKKCLESKTISEYVSSGGQIKCPEQNCKSYFGQFDMASVLGEEKFQELEMKLVLFSQNIVECFKCKGRFGFEIGNLTDVVKDAKGVKVEGDKLSHYINNRYTCPFPECKTEQCRSCNVSPYHIGFTCEEFAKQQKERKCRFCDCTIKIFDANKPQAIQDVCTQADCLQRANDICKKILACGHFCCGFNAEKNCLPCLDENCIKPQDNLQQNSEDYCNICFTEALRCAPCVRSRCGHVFHQECIIKRLETRWNGPRIVFNFCLCPLCKQWLDFPEDNQSLSTIMKKNTQIYAELKSKVLERLTVEGRQNDAELKDIKHPYYQKPLEYGMAIFAYYECHKCLKPYFGGLKSCQLNIEDDRRQYDKTELVCPACCPVSFDSDCKKHGKDYIEFKCRYCCTPALWFCWGTTHFCEPCHRKANEMKNKKPKDLTQCKNAESCALRVAHKPNGEECALGCGMCKQERMLAEAKPKK